MKFFASNHLRYLSHQSPPQLNQKQDCVNWMHYDLREHESGAGFETLFPWDICQLISHTDSSRLLFVLAAMSGFSRHNGTTSRRSKYCELKIFVESD